MYNIIFPKTEPHPPQCFEDKVLERLKKIYSAVTWKWLRKFLIGVILLSFWKNQRYSSNIGKNLIIKMALQVRWEQSNAMSVLVEN